MILIIGRTGSGKDYLARELAKSGLKQVLSYTTRPPRTPDENTHIFISPEETGNYNDKIATTVINGYEYFATKQQMTDNDVYIIDPNGTYELLENCPDVPFIICYLRADNDQRRDRAVGRGADKQKEAEVFDKRDASEDPQFSAFEKMLSSDEEYQAFLEKYPNTVVLNKRNDYKAGTMETLASGLAALNASSCFLLNGTT